MKLFRLIDSSSEPVKPLVQPLSRRGTTGLQEPLSAAGKAVETQSICESGGRERFGEVLFVGEDE